MAVTRHGLASLVFALAVFACGDPKTAPAEEVDSVSLVLVSGQPHLVLTEQVGVRGGGRSKQTRYRLDVREMKGGARVGTHVFAKDELAKPICFPADEGRVWCWTLTNPTLEMWDVTRLERTDDLSALTARFPALGDARLNSIPVAVPGTGEIEVRTGQDDRWILGSDPLRDDGGKAYDSRMRGTFAEVPEHSFGLNTHSEPGKTLFSFDNVDLPTTLGKTTRASLLTDSETRRTLRWDPRRLTLLKHEVAGAEGTALEFVALGYDGTTKWATQPVVGRLAHVTRLDDAVVLVLTHERAARLLCIDVETGVTRWEHAL